MATEEPVETNDEETEVKIAVTALSLGLVKNHIHAGHISLVPNQKCQF